MEKIAWLFAGLTTIGVVLACIMFGSTWLRKLGKKKEALFVKPMRELQFRYHYQVSDTYGYVDKNRIVTESEAISIFSMNKTAELSVVIDSYYNGKHYLIYDMDDVNKYGDMCRNFEFNGAIWQSSPGHHWIITDNPLDHLGSINTNLAWLTYSDDKHVKFVQQNQFNYIPVRALYMDLKRQPMLLEIKGEVSDDFKEFMQRLSTHYNDLGLRLSTLMTKDETMLNLYYRKKKLERILK